MTYNFHHHVASDIGEHNKYIPSTVTETQDVVNNIKEWTDNQKIKLNSKKTKYMIINYTNNYQFNTRISLEGNILDCIDQIRLLGVEIRDDLSWKANTASITKKVFGRMSLLREHVGFGIPKNNLVLLYIIFIRSKLEYCCVLWHSSITREEITNLDRVQKCAVRAVSYTHLTLPTKRIV